MGCEVTKVTSGLRTPNRDADFDRPKSER